MKKLLIPLVFTLLLLPITAFPQVYIGGTVGQSDVGGDFDTGTSYSVLGGYRFGRYVALEAAYIDYGEVDDDLEPIWTLEGDAWDIAVLGILPVGEKFELFAKVGFSSWDVTLSEQGYGKLGGLDGEDINYGVGMAFNFTEHFSMSLGYQRYEFEAFGEEDEIDNIYLGAKYYFGAQSKEVATTQTYVQPESQYAAVSGVQLRAVNEAVKGSCKFIKTVTKGAGGAGDPSANLERAMASALTEAADSGADSYFIVDTSTTATGASVVLEALDCQ